MAKQKNAQALLTPLTRRRVAILCLPPVDALDVIGPAEVFSHANRLHGGGAPAYALELISANLDTKIESETGIGLHAHRTLEQERRSGKPIDTLIVTTGFGAIDHFDPGAIEWIRVRAKTARRVCSICVGAFALAEAGILDGRKATTHWRMAQQLAQRYPRAIVDPAPIWVKDGNVYTSAGISAGIDLALSLVAEDLGDKVALEIAKDLVLFLRRPGGQAQFSAALQSQQAPSSVLADLCLWIGEHLHLDLTIEMLADRQAASVRTLIRLFQRELGTTPAKYVENIRLEAVCRALELGSPSMDDIAHRCGYKSVEVMRHAFIRKFGISPKDYKSRFATGDQAD